MFEIRTIPFIAFCVVAACLPIASLIHLIILRRRRRGG